LIKKTDYEIKSTLKDESFHPYIVHINDFFLLIRFKIKILPVVRSFLTIFASDLSNLLKSQLTLSTLNRPFPLPVFM